MCKVIHLSAVPIHGSVAQMVGEWTSCPDSRGFSLLHRGSFTKKEKNVGNGKTTKREKKSSVVDDGKSLLSFFSLPVRRLLGRRSSI